MLDSELRWIYKARFVASALAIITFGIIYYSGWIDFPFYKLVMAPLFLIIFNRPFAWPNNRFKNLNAVLLTGQIIDILAITWSLYYIGSINLFFGLIFYPLVIIYSSFILSVRNTFIIANIAFIAYAALAVMGLAGLEPRFGSIDIEIEPMYRMALALGTLFCFNLVAYFSAHHSKALNLGRNRLGITINQLQKEVLIRENTERALEKERLKFVTIFDGINEPICVTDPSNYKILYVNEAFKKLWGDPGDTPCYHHIGGYESPCSTCNNSELFEKPDGRSVTKEVFNNITERWFKCISKAIQWTDNRWVRYEMKFDITAQKRMELIQTVLFEISDAANKTMNLDELLRIIHHALGMLMDTTNFYIALYDSENKTYSFPYDINKYKEQSFTPQQLSKSLTDYVRRTGKPLWADKISFDKLYDSGEIEIVGKRSAIWLGVPLNTPSGVIGVAAVHNHDNPDTYSRSDLEVLTHVSGYIATAIERKIAEKTLADAKGLLTSTIESTADGIFVISKNQKIIYTNQRFLDLWNVPEELRKSMDYNWMIDHVLGRVRNSDKLRAKVRELQNLADVDYDTVELSDGRVCELYSCPLKENELVSGRVWSFRDITKGHRAQKLLRQSERSYRSFLESMQDGVMIADLEETLLFVNSSLGAMLGYEIADMIGQNLSKFIIEEDFGRITLGTQKRIRKEHSKYDIRMKRKDGQIREIHISATPLIDESSGVVKGAVGILSDITEQKISEREKRDLRDKLTRAQRMESLGILAGGVAHDLNNILGPLVAYPDIIRMNLEPDHPILKHISKIENSAQRAAGVVQDLLTMARRGRYEMSPLDLNKIIEEYLGSPDYDDLISHYPEINLNLDLERNMIKFNGSSPHLSKVVMNLIINAIEAMPDGGSLTIKTRSRYLNELHSGFDNIDAGEYIVLSVTDTGLGIEEKDLIHLFEPFYTKKKLGRSGSGLGLAIVYGVIKDHNGYVDIQSETNKGSTFYIYLPVSSKSDDIRKTPSVIDIRGNETILIVDDLEEQRDLASAMLSGLGYSIETASSGQEAVMKAKLKRYDLVVLDMIMVDGFDGLDTYIELIKLNPSQKAVIASGFSETERVIKAEQLGVGKFVKKPYTMQVLGKAIREVLQSESSGDKLPVA